MARKRPNIHFGPSALRYADFSRALGPATGALVGTNLWTPSLITTALWLDASDTDTITENPLVPGAVQQWDDKSGERCQSKVLPVPGHARHDCRASVHFHSV